MTGVDVLVFVALVVAAVALVVAIAWYVQWKRRPEEFKESWRRTPAPGSPNDWRHPR